MSYSGKATGFGATGGKATIVWGGFNSIDDRVSFAMIKLKGMGWREITKVQLFASNNTTGLSFASDALTGNYRNGVYTIPVGHNHFTDMTYLAVYFEGSTALVNIYFEYYYY